MGKLTERMKKEKKGRKRIAKILSAMKFHDPHLQATIKLMRNKLREIKQRESSVKPQKVIFKFNGSKHVVLHRRSPQTLLSPNHETHEVMSLENPPNLTAEMNMSNDHDVMDFIKSVGGSEVELVIEKRLTQSDVNTNQGRLLIPILQVKNRGFLTPDEELILLMGKKQGISVSVFDPERRKWTLNLTKWKMSKEYNYVFKTHWNDVVTANGWNHVVKANGEMVIIRVLSFRVDQQLCFALDRVA